MVTGGKRELHQTLNGRVTRTMYNRVDAISLEHGWTKGQILREALTLWLAEYDKTSKRNGR